MFKNMGKKIKVLSIVMMWVGFAMWCISGLFLIGSGVMMLDYGIGGVVSIIGGLIVIALGFLFSWIGSFISYGFGQIVDNTDKLVRILEKHTGVDGEPEIIIPQVQFQPQPQPQPQAQPVQYQYNQPENQQNIQ